MSALSDLFLGGILQIIIPIILVFYLLNSEGGVDACWKVNLETAPISAMDMSFFF